MCFFSSRWSVSVALRHYYVSFSLCNEWNNAENKLQLQMTKTNVSTNKLLAPIDKNDISFWHNATHNTKKRFYLHLYVSLILFVWMPCAHRYNLLITLTFTSLLVRKSSVAKQLFVHGKKWKRLVSALLFFSRTWLLDYVNTRSYFKREKMVRWECVCIPLHELAYQSNPKRKLANGKLEKTKRENNHHASRVSSHEFPFCARFREKRS